MKKIVLFALTGTIMMVILFTMSYDALAESHGIQTSYEEDKKEYIILFSPLEQDTKSLDDSPVLIGLILDQKNILTWINQDDSPLAINGDGWSTGKINPGNSGSVQFNATGIYDFTSDTHTEINGTIAVYQKDDENFISLAKPTSLLSMASDKNLKFSGEEIEDNLIRIIESVK